MNLVYNNIDTIIKRIKHDNPLILNITNYVTMEFVANGLLSLGASPIMTCAAQEAGDLVAISNAVIINIGTLNDEFIALCEQVCQHAAKLSKPIILDPVGVGASHYRTQACLNLMKKFKIDIIRGNASEIMALSGAKHSTKGVDANISTADVIENAKCLATQHDLVIVMSGKMDAAVSPDKTYLSYRGSATMPMVTGSGCLLTSIIGAFDSVCHDRFEAACAAVVFYGVCGELAATKTATPGTFKMCFLDALSSLPEKNQYADTMCC